MILHQQGFGEVVRQAICYLRTNFQSNELTGTGANYLGASLRRWALLTSSLGVPVGDVRSLMQPYWRVVRAWHLALPPDFRAPVPATLALALAVWGYTREDVAFALLVVLGHHCLLRPEELRRVRYKDVHLFPKAQYHHAYGMVGITAAKTRRMRAHARLQHVLLEDACLVQWVERVWSVVPTALHSHCIWDRKPEEFWAMWHQGLLALGVAHGPWKPSGLRGGGAAEHYLHNRDVQ
eukprot:1347244-Amphidinium_carterae.1